MTNYYIGLMSGTSMDAVDTAVVEFSATGAQLIAYREFPIAAELKAAVRKLDSGSSIAEISRYDYLLGELFADAVLKILDTHQLHPTQIAAIGSHGQTILHLPDEAEPRTLQIGDPNIIAQRTGIATVADFRRMDMAASGQGAPLAPAFHNWAFRKPGVERLVLNIGGIANLSLLSADPDQPTRGFDSGPGNGLLDDWNQTHRDTEMDRHSQWAASGKVHRDLLKNMLADPYFTQPPPKSTGRDYFNMHWLRKQLATTKQSLPPEDVQATLFELTRSNICAAIQQFAPRAQEIYVCGGGAHNRRLMQALTESLDGIVIKNTGDLGVDPDAVEAVTFAWLARQRMQGHPGNCTAVTGAASPQILGGVYLPQSAAK